jgi:hypothetical protein
MEAAPMDYATVDDLFLALATQDTRTRKLDGEWQALFDLLGPQRLSLKRYLPGLI